MKKMTNEKWLYFFNGVLFVLLVLSCIFAGVQRGRVAERDGCIRDLRTELNGYRERVADLERTQCELNGTIDEAKAIINGANGSIRNIGGSVAEIRAGLKKLQDYIEALESCLWGNDSRNGACDSGLDNLP